MTADILWDWNGTLLDDTRAALDTLNDMLAARGRPGIGMEFYRSRFSFPVKPFYESIGIEVADDDWDELAREYHDRYLAKPKRINVGVFEALTMVREAGVRQSVISALRQDYLDRETVRYGVREFMAEVFGTDNLDGASKMDRAHELMARLGADPARTVVIGDSLHDLEVADSLGARCVLHGLGSHSIERLRAVAPAGETLCEAVRIALGS